MRLLVAVLLRLFPAGFRRTFGADLLATFEDRWRERRGWGLAPVIVADLVHSAFLERLSQLHRAMDRPAEPPVRKGDSLVTTIWHDLRFALRMLRKAPGFKEISGPGIPVGSFVDGAAALQSQPLC
ncbi:MAG: hypothetical protein LAQ69_24235 [Acidobacteriia bacterium]|nr:hypothetical protein [Terriglobia bacterium]